MELKQTQHVTFVIFLQCYFIIFGLLRPQVTLSQSRCKSDMILVRCVAAMDIHSTANRDSAAPIAVYFFGHHKFEQTNCPGLVVFSITAHTLTNPQV